ncbi:MAG: DUF721 domain-containing protein [Thermodesulfobacteriota bacterium]
MSRKHTPDHISSLLGEMITRRHWQDRFELHEVFDFWEKAVGKEIASHATPAKYRGKVLWVDVSDSIWMQQLQFLKTALMDKVNKEFDSVEVEDIRFQLRLPTDDTPKRESPPRPVGPAPDAGDLTQFEEFLGDIDDPELKVAMLRCWRSLFPYQDE